MNGPQYVKGKLSKKSVGRANADYALYAEKRKQNIYGNGKFTEMQQTCMF